jgi:pyruvate,orthophosphate dikinase
MTRKRIYRFQPGHAEGRADFKALLGGKGANLAEMARLGIPVPPGFTITTELCTDYFRTGRMPDGLMDDVRASMQWLEHATGKCFGAAENPLLVSVRSGARSSMPGMMDTILDLGLNDASVAGLARQSRSERFALDAYRRLLGMFGSVVFGLGHESFEHVLLEARRRHAESRGLTPSADPEELARAVPDTQLDAAELGWIVQRYKQQLDEAGRSFPADPYAQLEAAIAAVFESWRTPRARLYRQMHGIPDDWGTAVNVQAMVFGNLGDSSATGVAFTRDPSTGERRFFGEWLPNAQGEDVVAGIRTPRPLAGAQEQASLERALPESYRQLVDIQARLEQHFRDMQDIEFTIEAGKLYILQTRSAKRSARASVRIAVEMVAEHLISPDEAILRVDPARLPELLFPVVDPAVRVAPLATGLAAAPGAVSGRVVFSAAAAEEQSSRGEHVILVRAETSPEDLHGMKAARAILTARGGATSHAAVVARGMGRPCVVGCAALSVHSAAGVCEVRGPDGAVIERLAAGDVITVDGSSGRVYRGKVPTLEATLSSEMQTLLGWTDRVRRLGVRANADTPAQAEKALALGAEGIGLCRTEHMFFDAERILAMREMILAGSEAERARALAILLPFQVSDFVRIFEVMGGRPVTVRLLDPPLHEFLPREPVQLAQLARALGSTPEEVERRADQLREQNPMLGHRGVRLAITYPEIAAMQVEAILTAACRVRKHGTPVEPEIMVPLVLGPDELVRMRGVVDRVAAEVFHREGLEIGFAFGTMIELPRAALVADQIARSASFFSFGTNDLTQTTLGLSRDDAGSFMPSYLAQQLLHEDPFLTLDRAGVGELVRIAAERGRRTRPDLKLGLCGEHGGDPRSIEFCEQLGLDYVSCSPFRVPVARLAAAQAALRKS